MKHFGCLSLICNFEEGRRNLVDADQNAPNKTQYAVPDQGAAVSAHRIHVDAGFDGASCCHCEFEAWSARRNANSNRQWVSVLS